MPDGAALRRLLERLDGRPWGAWRDLRGSWELDDFTLIVDHVQGDPFAAPSRMRCRFSCAGLPGDALGRRAAEDWFHRRAFQAARSVSSRRGSGHSGQLGMDRPGPEMIERSAVRVREDQVTLRMEVGLPGKGRRIHARAALQMFFEDLPRMVSEVQELGGFEQHLACLRQQVALRAQLDEHGLVGFIANGSILPRASGVSGRPMEQAVPFQSPPTLEVELPGADSPVRGLGIPRGVTVIVGGGFHGKSTVLSALRHGHFDHIPGDGREGVVSLSQTVSCRAEDGRAVHGVDLSAFLGELPGGHDTRRFVTEDASGSTSQAAGIMEAVECGARVLLMDEDSCATNLMVSDERMQAVIRQEPIIPLLSRVRGLYESWGISSIFVIGGIADYLGVADTVIAMDRFLPSDAGQAAKGMAIEVQQRPLDAPPAPRTWRRSRGPARVRGLPGAMLLDKRRIELGATGPLVSESHSRSVGHAIRFACEELVLRDLPIPTVLDAMDAILDDEGVDVLSPWDTPDGRLVRPRREDLAAALNRWRSAPIDRAETD